MKTNLDIMAQPDYMEERKKALAAITAYRQLKGLKLLSQDEDRSIIKKITEKYGEYLSPLR